MATANFEIGNKELRYVSYENQVILQQRMNVVLHWLSMM